MLLTRYVQNGLGTKPVSAVTTSDVYALLTGIAVRKKPAGPERKAAAPHLAVIARQALDGVFRLALMSGRAAVNPAS